MNIIKNFTLSDYTIFQLTLFFLGFLLFLFYSIIIFDFNNTNTFQLLTILGLSLPVGYLALYPLRTQFNIPSIGMVPFYLAVGFILNFIWSLSVSPFTLNPIFLFSLFQISIISIFYIKIKKYMIKKNILKSSSKEKLKSSLLSTDAKKWIIVTSLFLISIILFVTISEKYPNPLPYSDLTTYHSILAQAILEHGNLSHTLTDAKILDFHSRLISTIAYPIGFHVNIVSYSQLFDLALPQTAHLILIISTLLIFGVLISTSFFMTRSILITISSMAAFFYVIFPRIDQPFLFFNISDGGGTIQLGILCFVSSLFLLLSCKKKYKPSFLLILFMLFLGTGFSHPSLIPYFLILIISYFIAYFRKILPFSSKLCKQILHKPNFKSFNVLYFLRIVLFVGMIVGMIVGEIYLIQINIIESANYPVSKYDFSTGHTFNVESNLIPSYFLFTLIVTSLFYLFYIKKYSFYPLAMILLFLTTITVSSFGIYLSIFAPSRFTSLLVPMTWILLGMLITQIRYSLLSKINKLNKKYYFYSNVLGKLYHSFLFYSPLIFLIISLSIFTQNIMPVFDMNSAYYENLKQFNP